MHVFSNPRRSRLAIALVAVAITAVACSSSSKKSASGTVASQLILGGAPECPQRPFCIPGLQKTYGITFQSFKPLDEDGSLTYAAITSGAVQVALVFSSDAQIQADNLVVLNDDKHLQNADYVTPVVRKAKDT